MDADQAVSADGKATSSSIEGLSLIEINDKVRAQYQIPRDIEGLLILEVKDGSKAEKIGFREGDIIIQLEQMPISSVKDLNSALKEYKEHKKRVVINRRN